MCLLSTVTKVKQKKGMADDDEEGPQDDAPAAAPAGRPAGRSRGSYGSGMVGAAEVDAILGIQQQPAAPAARVQVHSDAACASV